MPQNVHNEGGTGVGRLGGPGVVRRTLARGLRAVAEKLHPTPSGRRRGAP